MLRFIFFICACVISTSSTACEFAQVTFDTQFSTGRLASCEQKSPDKYILQLRPENTPINNSPWYAFKVTAKKAQTIEVTLQVQDGDHRYSPKISTDKRHWQAIKYKIKKDKMRFKLKVSSTPLWVAGQEIIDNQYYYQWGQALTQRTPSKQDILGWSVQQRPIFKIESTNTDNKELVVILGRMHPPELTGAIALFPFVQTLFSDSPLAKQFRQRFAILVVPNLNPDGVYLGNWRHNANGVDLNRQWKTFAEPEVSAVHNYLTKLTQAGKKISMAVDFHSTHKDIFYTMPADYGVEQPFVVRNWLNSLDALYPDFKVIQKPGNNPDKGVFKQYIADQFNVHAITYEMGDNTDRAFIHKLAIDAANTFMQTQLQNNDKER